MAVEFLRSVYPILKESGRFFDEIMVKDPVHNWLVVCPSNSPENVHSGSNGKATTAAGCTMDNQLIFDLWTAIISASQILDTDQEFASHLTQRLKEIGADMARIYREYQEREIYLEEKAAEGEKDVTIPLLRPDFETIYSDAYNSDIQCKIHD